MSGFKRFVSLLSSSLIALGGVSASGNVDVLKRKDAGKIGVPLPNISRENNGAGEKEKKNKKIVGNGKKDGVGGAGRKEKKNKKIVGNGKRGGVDGAGQKSASGVRNIDEILSRMPDGEVKFNLKRDIEEYKEKGGENLIRWENIWRSIFISGSYAPDSKQVIEARGAIEAFYNDSEALELIDKFVSDPNNLANKTKINELISKLGMKSWGKYLLSWLSYILVDNLGCGITGCMLYFHFVSVCCRFISDSLGMSDDDIEKYLSGDSEAKKKWGKVIDERYSEIVKKSGSIGDVVGSSLKDFVKIFLVGVVLTKLLEEVLSRPLNISSYKDYGKKKELEKILKFFKK